MQTAVIVALVAFAPLVVGMDSRSPAPTPEEHRSIIPSGDSYALLRATQEAFRDVATRMRPFLVRIETVGGSQPRGRLRLGDDDEQPQEEGPSLPKRTDNTFRETLGSQFVVADGPTTGIVYSADGYIVTSSFNFVREPILISVALHDGRRFVAELVARDQVRKIALLKVDVTGQGGELPVPTWCDPSDVRVGQWAIALGLGFGGDEPSITAGIVSALNRMLGNAIQTDAKLSPANYGGPVCDIHGRVLGIGVPMAQRPGELAGIELYDSGVGFALPKDRIDEIVAVLKTGQSFYRGWLGIQIDRKVKGSVVISKMADPSPMRDAGVETGDKILGANGKALKHFGHLVQSLYMIPAGETVYLHIDRAGREFGVAVKLARNIELGALPEAMEPFDPSNPIPLPSDNDLLP